MFLLFFSENCQPELFDKIIQTEQCFDGLLLFTQAVCVAIIPCQEGSQYSLVDSHAWDSEGKPDVHASGIITKFEEILELISYITDN